MFPAIDGLFVKLSDQPRKSLFAAVACAFVKLSAICLTAASAVCVFVAVKSMMLPVVSPVASTSNTSAVVTETAA